MRLKYVDALRGFTMFLVVFGHVLSFGFGIEFDDSILADLFSRFRMPLFFFISGFIGYKSLDKFNLSYFKQSFKHKAFVQLVPTFIFFSFYMLTIGNSPLSFFKYGLQGYWFTLVLFEFFVFFYITSFFFNLKNLSKLQDYVYILIIPIFFVVYFYIRSNFDTAQPSLMNVFSVFNFSLYLPFFTFGLLARKHENVLLPIITNKYSCALAFIIFSLAFLLKERFFTREDYSMIYHIMNAVVLRFSGLIFIFNVFYHSADYFEKDTFVSRAMQFVGKRTLDIYLLHYFFLPQLSTFKHCFFVGGKEFIIGEILVMGLGIAIPILAICLLLSYSIRTSPILTKYLFGIVPKN